MRESIGGTMLFWIVLIFISIFITFMASVIKYAFTYKMKNSMIDYIERNEGILDKNEVEKKLLEIGYPTNGSFMVCKHYIDSKDSVRRVNWYVKLNATFQMPVINSKFDIPIQGETSYISAGLPNADETQWKSFPPDNCVCRGYNICAR